MLEPETRMVASNHLSQHEQQVTSLRRGPRESGAQVRAAVRPTCPGSLRSNAGGCVAAPPCLRCRPRCKQRPACLLWSLSSWTTFFCAQQCISSSLTHHTWIRHRQGWKVRNAQSSFAADVAGSYQNPVVAVVVARRARSRPNNAQHVALFGACSCCPSSWLACGDRRECL